jgi:hypothetical protein
MKTHAEEIGHASFGIDSGSHYLSDRNVLVQAFTDLHGRKPSVKEAQIIQSIGQRESGWARAWTGDGVGSNNVGCVHGTYQGQGFVQNDNDADGNPYSTSFRVYPSLYEGAKDFIHELTDRRPEVWSNMRRGDYEGTATAMHDISPIYYQASILVYLKGMLAAGQNIADTLGEKLVSPGWTLPDYIGLTVLGGIGYGMYKAWFGYKR